MGGSDEMDSFFRRVGESGCRILLLDYDGTLAPFREDRYEATPAPGVRDRLNRILGGGDGTRVVIVSGRPVRDVLDLASLEYPVEVWGCHGREHLPPGGDLRVIGVSESQQAAIEEVRDQAEEILPPQKIEVKTGCVAFHWRGVREDERKEMEARLRELCEEVAEREGMEVRPFDGGLELAVPGRSKGDVIETVLEEHGADGNCAVAFLGDDLTDEDGFRALGGRGLSVLVRNEERDTRADLRIPMPRGVLSFLDRWIEATEKDASS